MLKPSTPGSPRTSHWTKPKPLGPTSFNPAGRRSIPGLADGHAAHVLRNDSDPATESWRSSIDHPGPGHELAS